MVKMVATLDEFNQVLEDSKLVVVDFTASWCPPCQMIAPKFAELATQVQDKATLVKIDVDENGETAESCGISCMPTFQFYKNKEKVHEIQGANYDGVVAKINELTA
uniref:Thioredoxin n=1 Tax=Strombidium rassoulzadegani TaxID=1082188 RepID=A0A7S3CK91_9SPIT|eukprot:CAMPEP_0168615264 /NCGR_PEP_ID=MMETSP0449_2-20121227/4414_1 /TAXON_ID=1082188 /ORGANISM="Strombidium rassoulzadegani, Strain ras09" /LENGTH=105 /DNA_ID=CAMNT_0008655997 /DNA_START=30 /DNA_END=347 /DNA_ORIENTATION=-